MARGARRDARGSSSIGSESPSAFGELWNRLNAEASLLQPGLNVTITVSVVLKLQFDLPELEAVPRAAHHEDQVIIDLRELFVSLVVDGETLADCHQFHQLP